MPLLCNRVELDFKRVFSGDFISIHSDQYGAIASFVEQQFVELAGILTTTRLLFS